MPQENTNNTERRQIEQKTMLVEQLRRTPIVQAACEKVQVARATYYRWTEADKDFAEACRTAIKEGTELVSDLAESKLVGAIKDQNMSAISFWLRHRHPAYAEKLQIHAKVETNAALTAEQEALVRQALEHVTTAKQLTESYEQPTE